MSAKAADGANASEQRKTEEERMSGNCEKKSCSVEKRWPDMPEMWKIESNLDDCTGETLGYTMEKLLEAGAADVWYQPVYMKKNRPAVTLCVLCSMEQRELLEKIIFENTTTIGIRYQPVWRDTLPRCQQNRKTRYGEVKVKVCELQGEERIYPEYEEIRRICGETGKGYEQIRQEITSDLKKTDQVSREQEKVSAEKQEEKLKEKLKEKRQVLLKYIKACAKQDVVLAFSGGVDSSLLLKMACICARETGNKVWAVTFRTRLHPPCDMEIAQRVAAEMQAEHVVIEVDELEMEEIRQNPENRCYLCKKNLFGKLMKFAAEKGADCILDGTNADDLQVYRPGIRALKEYGVKSPLAICGITKAEVKALAASYDISVAERPSTPCMATRLPYGSELSYELLDRVAKGEEWIRNRLGGQRNIRLRVHGDVVRIETDQEGMELLLKQRKETAEILKTLGFTYITMDLDGFCSGSMDRKIRKEQKI